VSPWQRVCAWCGKTMGDAVPHPDGVTHTICDSCFEAEMNKLPTHYFCRYCGRRHRSKSRIGKAHMFFADSPLAPLATHETTGGR
jgi:NMD protein affecting ribosome stability and mRNA decay